VRARLRRRDEEAAEEAGRLEEELEQLRSLTDAVATQAESAVARIDQIVKENRA
jgi:hypothetical protein